MAVENKQVTTAVAAGADLTAMQYKIITPAGVIAAESDTALGVLLNKPDNGEHASVAVSGGMKSYAGASISLGARLKVTTSSFLIAVTSGDGAAVGKALEAANSGDLFNFHGDFASANTAFDQQ